MHFLAPSEFHVCARANVCVSVSVCVCVGGCIVCACVYASANGESELSVVSPQG